MLLKHLKESEKDKDAPGDENDPLDVKSRTDGDTLTALINHRQYLNKYIDRIDMLHGKITQQWWDKHPVSHVLKGRRASLKRRKDSLLNKLSTTGTTLDGGNIKAPPYFFIGKLKLTNPFLNKEYIEHQAGYVKDHIQLLEGNTSSGVSCRWWYYAHFMGSTIKNINQVCEEINIPPIDRFFAGVNKKQICIVATTPDGRLQCYEKYGNGAYVYCSVYVDGIHVCEYSSAVPMTPEKKDKLITSLKVLSTPNENT